MGRRSEVEGRIRLLGYGGIECFVSGIEVGIVGTPRVHKPLPAELAHEALSRNIPSVAREALV